MLIGTRINEASRPVVLDPSGLQHHALIVGQSGSGKSFFVARLVEEVLLGTRSRIVVVDPNGDFRSVGEVSEKVWQEHADRLTTASHLRASGPDFDAREGFEETWSGRRFLHLHLNVAHLPQGTQNVLHRRMYIHWDALAPEERDFLLRSTGYLTPTILLGLEASIAYSQFLAGRYPQMYGDDLRGLVNAAERFAERNVSMERYAYAKTLSQDDWYGVRAVAKELLRTYSVWWSHAPGAAQVQRPRGLNSFLDGPFTGALPASESFWDALLLGLDAAQSRDGLLAVNALLSRVWHNAKESWRRHNRVAGTPDDRVPTFIIVDEAQHFAPAVTEDPLRRLSTERLIQIASEGRKYGLYLVLATQRPTKLHPQLVAECENSCVLRIQSQVDAEFAAKTLGIPENLVFNASTLGTGQGIVAGRWASSSGAVVAHFLPARVKVAGGGLGKAWANRDAPSPAYSESRPSGTAKDVAAFLDASPEPVRLVELAEFVRLNCANVDDRDWNGFGSFKDFLRSLDIDGLAFSPTPPGYAFLSGKHAPPPPVEHRAASPRSLEADPVVSDALQSLAQATGAPYIDAVDYRFVFEALSEEVQERPFQLADCSRNIRDRALNEDRRIGRGAINFIIKGVHWGGHRYDPDLPQDAKTMAMAFLRNLRTLALDERRGDVSHLAPAFMHCGGELITPEEVDDILRGRTITIDPVLDGDGGSEPAPGLSSDA